MRIVALLRLVSACALLPSALFAQFTISGVTDKATPYNNTVTFTINTQAGYSYDATLNWNPIAVGMPVVVNQPDFYELRVNATNTTTSAVTSQYLRFIVKASERVDTEWGLPPHVPFPVIQSSASEFAGAHLRLTIPASFPVGYSIPVVAWAVDDEDHAVRANAVLKNSGATLFQVKRGVGSGFVSHTNTSGTLNLNLDLGGALTTNVSVALETGVVWTAVSGILNGATVWTNNSRIQITSGTIVPAGSSLTVGEGTIVRVNTGVNVTNNGTITIDGTLANPVVFMPTTSAPWGGFVQHANNATFTAIGTIFTGSGADSCWFGGHGRTCGTSGIDSHRGEQALISLNGANCNLTMTDCAATYLAGQLGHSVRDTASKTYKITLTRFLMQRATSGGEFTKANFSMNDSAVMECPDDTVSFVDGDNDGLYIVGGTHGFTNTLFGWTKDDGIDSGGTDDGTTGFGKLDFQSCWFEATFHEGNSLSGYKNTFARDTVYFDCGQGIEDGYNAPTGRVDHCFFSMCEAAIRHGDNYPTIGNYDGRFTGTNCISIYNHRDLFGFNWHNPGGWTNSYDRFFVSNNFVSALDTNYPNNTLWNPANDGWRLGSLGGVARAGMGFGVRGQPTLAQLTDGLPVGLSRFCTNEVQADYDIDTTGGYHASGTIIFPAGLTRRFISLPTNVTGVLRVALRSPVNADITSPPFYIFPGSAPGATNATLVAKGSVWRFLDTGVNAGTAWRSNSFDDGTWNSGPAQLGYGDGDEATAVSFGPNSSAKYITTYFRHSFNVVDPSAYGTLAMWLLRDDGGVVYLNGTEIYRSPSMPQPPTAINYQTYATNQSIANAPADNTVDTATIAASLLPGANVVAVEIHQHDASSSDISFDFELTASLTPAPPRIQTIRFGDDLTLYWNNAGFSLEEADEVTGPWRIIADNTTVGTVSLNGTQKFYRLKK